MPAEVADPPPPTKDTINPSLRALFDVEVAEPETQPETPPAKPPTEPEAPPVAPVDDKKPDANAKLDELKIRLAPDFAAKEAAPVVPVEPDVDLVELDAAIETAPTPKAKADLKKFRDQLASLKTEVTTLKAKPVPPPEDSATKTLLETVTKERDDLLARVEKVNLLDSPKFQRDHLQPRQKSFDRLLSVVKEGGADPAAIQSAIAMARGKPRNDALDEIRGEINSEMMKGRFDRLVEDIDSRTTDINEKLRNAKQAAEEMKRDETVQTHEQRMKVQKELEALLGSAISDLKENVGLEVLHKTGKPEYQWFDDQADEIMAVAKEIYLDATPQKAAIASVLAASAGPFRAMWQAERKARQAVEQENRELKDAEPSITPDRKGAKVETDGADADSIMARLRSGAYRK